MKWMIGRIVLQWALVFFIGVSMLVLANRAAGKVATACDCMELLYVSEQRWCKCRGEGEVWCSYTQWNYDFKRTMWVYICPARTEVYYECDDQWVLIGCCTWGCSSNPPPCSQPTCDVPLP